MKAALGVMSIAAISVFSIAAEAQTRPDFSGRWAISVDSGAGRGGAPGARGGGAAAGGGTGGSRVQGAGGGQGAGRQGGGAAGGRGGGMGSGWGSDITITQDASILTLQYVLFGRGDMQPPIFFRFALDGSESKNRFMLGWGVEDRTSRARWDADKLVITTVFNSPDPTTGAPQRTEMTQTMSMPTPTTLLVETARPATGGGAASVTRTTYTKM